MCSNMLQNLFTYNFHMLNLFKHFLRRLPCFFLLFFPNHNFYYSTLIRMSPHVTPCRGDDALLNEMIVNYL